MINKNKFSIQDTKKVLHKVGKQWVVVSAVLLGLVAGGTAVSQMNVSADVAQPIIQKSQDVNKDSQRATPNSSSVQSGKSSANDTSASTSYVPSVSSSDASFSSASNASSTSQSTSSELPSNNSDSINKDLSSALNVDKLYDAVQNHKNSYDGDYGLFPIMTDVPNLHSDNYNVTPTDLLSFLNDLNKNLQGYAINNIGIRNLSNNVNEILDNVSRSLSKKDNISLKTFLYNLHDNIYIISDNYKRYDNDDKNIINITSYLNRLKGNSINIAGYNISNPHPLNNNDVYSIAMIMNDMGNIRSNDIANDNYENIFNILNDYVENHKGTQNSSDILDMISNNLSNIIKEANLPNDTFSNTLNSLSVATKSKASSVNSSVTASAYNHIKSLSNSLSRKNNYSSLVSSDTNKINDLNDTIKMDKNKLTNSAATNASSAAVTATNIARNANSKIYLNQIVSASQDINQTYSTIASISNAVQDVLINGNDYTFLRYNYPELFSSDNNLISSAGYHTYMKRYKINEYYSYYKNYNFDEKSSAASNAESYLTNVSKEIHDTKSAASHEISVNNSLIASFTAQSADQNIKYSYEDSVSNSVSEMNSKTADNYAKSANQSIGNSYQKSVADSVANANSSKAQSTAQKANQSLESSIASSYARSTNQSIANSYQNSVSDSVVKANNSKAKSAAQKANQNLESSIAQSYANSANQSIANSYKDSVASVNNKRARSASQSVKNSIANADASKKTQGSTASNNLNPGDLFPNINIPDTSNMQTPSNTQTVNTPLNASTVPSSSTQISQMSSSDDINAISSNASLSSSANHSTKRANNNYLKNNDFKHTSKHKSIVSMKGLYEYKRNHKGRMKRVAFVKPGAKLAVKRVVRNGKITKLELTNGHIITANRGFVKLANVKKAKRTSAYTKALRKITYRTRHGRRLNKFRAHRAMKRLVTANKVTANAQSKFNHRRTVRNHRALNRAIKKLNRIEKILLK